MTEKLTPTEDLIMEVLIARHRLGETLWTFDARHSKTLNRLADRGLINPMHGIVEYTVRASLSDAFIANLGTNYVPPVLRTADDLLVKALEAGDRFGRYSSAFAEAIQVLRKHLGADRDRIPYHLGLRALGSLTNPGMTRPPPHYIVTTD